MDHHWESLFDSWRHHQLPPALPWFQTSADSLIHPMRHVTQIPNHRSNQYQISIMYGTVSSRCNRGVKHRVWPIRHGKSRRRTGFWPWAYTVRKCRITHQSQFMAGIVPQYIGEYDTVSLIPRISNNSADIPLRYSDMSIYFPYFFIYFPYFFPIVPYNQPTDRFSAATAIHAASASASPRVVAPQVLVGALRFEVFGSSATLVF